MPGAYHYRDSEDFGGFQILQVSMVIVPVVEVTHFLQMFSDVLTICETILSLKRFWPMPADSSFSFASFIFLATVILLVKSYPRYFWSFQKGCVPIEELQ